MRRLTLACAVLALAASACERRQQQAAAPAAPPAPAPARPAGPLTYQRTIPTAEVSLTLPEAVGRIPALYARLYGEDRKALDAFADASVEEVESLRAAGLPAPAYAQTFEYSLAAETPRLIGLTRLAYENTGGAHPNSALTGLVWDKTANTVVETAALFAKGADMAAADEALCDAIKAEKRSRIGDDSFNSAFPACPALATSQATLLPSVVKGKAAGLTVLFSPYDIGAYAEGAYEIDLPLAAFQAVLAPDYAGEFAGAPAPRPASR